MTHLARRRIGFARAQNAVIDTMERVNPDFRNNHRVPLLTVATNMRANDPRMIDLPSPVLLRLQRRVALDPAAVKVDLERLISGAATASAPPAAAAPWKNSEYQRQSLEVHSNSATLLA